MRRTTLLSNQELMACGSCGDITSGGGSDFSVGPRDGQETDYTGKLAKD